MLKIKFTTVVILLMIFGMKPAAAEEWRTAASLAGVWRIEIGDDPAYADPNFDDSKWETIHVPGAWERQGFPGYDGFAWYRKRFSTPDEAFDYQLYLDLGRIDDVDETYLNGHMIGYQGSVPPRYRTAYNVNRRYLIPPDFLNPAGENVIAVRVYDDELVGGIVDGKIALVYDRDEIRVSYHLQGDWKLKRGDDLEYAEQNYDDTSWQKVAVPCIWDGYGLKNYDGIGWYRIGFNVPQELADEKVVLMLGKIDDVEQVYLNGRFLGKTGYWRGDSDHPEFSGDHYSQERAYFIPQGYLLPGQENVLAVRVFDGMLHGGIWDGPVGLMTRKDYLRRKSRESLLDQIFLELFGK